nr:uncharacterized protein LOC105318438 isoform X2 [Crassostrea gigas]
MEVFWFISLDTLTFSIVLMNVLSIRSLKTSGVCKQHGGLYRCCNNFRQEGQNCIPCVGSFGINCSGRCVDGFFGFGCLGRCNCSEDQICDSRDGCMEDKIRQYEENLYHLDITSMNLFTPTRRKITHLINIKVT